MEEEHLFMDDQIKWFLEVESTLRKDSGKIVGLITKDLEHYLNLAEKKKGGRFLRVLL